MLIINNIRKKPIIIQGIKLDTNFIDEQMIEIAHWCQGIPFTDRNGYILGITIDTLEGKMKAFKGKHWILCGVNGEFYPCENDILTKTYDIV